MDAATVRRLRRRAGLTQRALARKLGVHPLTVSRWERGQVRITTPMARLLALTLKTKPDKGGR